MNLKKTKLLLFSLGVFGGLGVFTQIMAAPENNNQTPSSKTPKAPTQYKVRASFDKAKYFLGENAMLNFSIENTGKDPITLDTGGDYRGTVRSTRFRVKALAQDGSVVPDPHPDADIYCEGGLGGSQQLYHAAQANFSVSLPLYARIENPGKYKVSISHDFGWRLPDDKRPTGTADVEFVAPSAAEATKLVQDIYKEAQSKPSAGQTNAFDDVNCLAYPVYLQPLLGKVEHGDAKEAESAVEGIGKIASTDATKSLLKIATGSNRKLATLAARQLALRLPDPQLRGELPRRSVFEATYDSERKHLVKASWQDSFAPAVRELGKTLLKSSDKQEQQTGAFMLQCVADGDSSKSVVAALDAAITKSKTLPFESQIYPRPRGNVAELMRTAAVLAKRGSVSQSPQSPGECALYMTLMAKDAQFRPADWETRYAGFFKSDIPYLRELALKTLPTPVPPALIAEVSRLLKDRDVDVQIAACEVAQKVKGDTFKKDLQFVLANAKEQWLINAASNALAQSDRVEHLRILASKFDDPKLTDNTLFEFIPCIVKVDSWGSRSGLVASDDDDKAVAGKRMKTLWLKFIKDNEAFLRGGAMVKPGDPRITADYLPHSMALGQVNGKDWPPLKAINPSSTNFQDKALQDRLVQKVKDALPPKWQIKSRGTGLPEGWICSTTPCFRVTITDGKSDNAIWYVPANWIAIRKPTAKNVSGGNWDCINGNATTKVMCQQGDYKFQSENFRSMLSNAQTASLINNGFDLSKQIFAGKEHEVDRMALQLVNENCKTAKELQDAAISLIELGVPAKQVFLKASHVKGDTTWFISALRLLGDSGGKETSAVFMKMLGDPDSTDLVRERSAQALQEMGALNDAVPQLTKAVQITKSEESLCALAKALASTGSPQSGKAILAVFNRTQNPYFKVELADLIASTHDKDAYAALQKLESEISNCKDGKMSGGTHFNDWQLQEMKQKLKAALRRAAESR